MPVPPPVPVRERRPPVEAERAPSTSANPLLEREPSILERTYWVRFWEKLNGEEGAGLLISLVLHSLMLAVLAIPVYRSMQEEQIFTTVVQKKSEDDVRIDQPMNTEAVLASPAPSGEKTLTAPPLLEIPEMADQLLPNVDPSDLPTLPGADGDGDSGADTGRGGFRIAEPANAVRAGNFSVWPWPIEGKDLQGHIVHGEPGGSPRVFQPYHIVIRLKVPKGQRRVRIGDFSGMIVGTDSYKQEIPKDAWYFDRKGQLTRGLPGRSIPVIEGTAEFLIFVPGAGQPAVKDTITVSCRLTKEEQKIELVFQPPGAPPQ